MNRPYFVFEVTPRCGSDCLYCYNVWKQRDDYPEGELTFSAIARLFEKLLSEVRPSGVTLAGGEPLLHPHIAKISTFLSGKNIPVSVVTNGTILDEETAGNLADAGVGHFEISIPSMDRFSYAKLTRDERLGEARKALLCTRSAGSKLTVSTVITRLNLIDIGEVIELAAAFSADSVSLNRFVPGGEGLRHLSELTPTRDDLEQVLAAADAKSADLGIPVAVTIPVEPCLIDHKQFPRLHFGACSCGKDKWVIDPLGNLRTCEQNPEILGSIFLKSFADLAGSARTESFRNDGLNVGCGECDLYENCGGGCRFLRRSGTK